VQQYAAGAIIRREGGKICNWSVAVHSFHRAPSASVTAIVIGLTRGVRPPAVERLVTAKEQGRRHEVLARLTVGKSGNDQSCRRSKRDSRQSRHYSHGRSRENLRHRNREFRLHRRTLRGR
jgi:hypothetical protein